MISMSIYPEPNGGGSGFGMDAQGRQIRWTDAPDGAHTEYMMVAGPETDDSWALGKLREMYDCDCYQPHTAHELVRDILRLMPLHQGTTDECEQLVGSVGAFHIVLDRMTQADLITHGGSIGGSWLEDDGERLLAILDKAGDLDEWAGNVQDAHWTWEEVKPPVAIGSDVALTEDERYDLIRRLTYKPGFYFQLQPHGIAIVGTLPNSRGDGPVNVMSGALVDSRDTTLTAEQLVWRVHKACVTFETHEIDEWFALDGELWNDPHAAPDARRKIPPPSDREIWETRA